MSEETEAPGEDGDEDLAEGLEKKKISGKLILIIVIALLVIGGGAAVTMFFMGGDDEHAADLEGGGQEHGLEADDEDAEPTDLLFFDLEPMVINLNTGGGKASYLKLTISLEVDRQSAIDELTKKMPRVVDNFQVYLRELRIEDLNGSAGMFRLKEELLIRVNEAVYPTRVHDVLFKEIFIN